MRYFLLKAFFFFLLMTACQYQEPESVQKTEVLPSETVTLNSTQNPLQDWKELINSSIHSFENIYTADAIKLLENGQFLEGSTAIKQAYDSIPLIIDSIFSKEKIIADRKETYEYEIGGFSSTNGKEYRHLLIWKRDTQVKLRALELIVELEADLPSPQVLNARRTEWIRLCNQHNAEKLVDGLYAENTLYYNHKPMVVGRKAVSKEYEYMNRDDYSLHLEPILVEPVRTDLIFEIGQCSGSYGGKYILIWQKNALGVWEILMDSNI